MYVDIFLENHVRTDATQIFFLTLCHLQCCTCNTANIFAFSWKWSMRFLESWQILVLTFSQMRLLLCILCYHQYVKKSVRFCPSADFPLLRLITVVTSHIGWWPLLGTRINSFVLFSTVTQQLCHSHSSCIYMWNRHNTKHQATISALYTGKYLFLFLSK